MSTPAGLLLVDKSPDWTSHDVVAKVRRLANTRRVGHAGTLDPMATGLLVIGVNSATKLLTFLVGADKTYEATIRLGASTITDDAESDALAQADESAVAAVTDAQISVAIEHLTGEIRQVPSSVSAIKVDGVRSYTRARAGDQVKLAARPITVRAVEILGEPRRITVEGHAYIDLDARIECSSGTYIRALARDLGEALGVGGHLIALRRTKVGHYSIDSALTLEQLGDVDTLPILNSADAARAQFTCIELSESDVTDLRHGKRLKLADKFTGPAAAFAPDGALVAMVEQSGSQVKSLVVFAE